MPHVPELELVAACPKTDVSRRRRLSAGLVVGRASYGGVYYGGGASIATV